MKKLLKYEFYYLRKTQKFTVFAGIFILFSIISPLTAKYIQEILAFLLNGQDLGIPVPDPTVYTAYEQYISDLYESIFFIVLFVSVSIFIRDKTKGLLLLVFSKPINRVHYILSKYVSFLLLLLVSTFVGYLLFTYYTYFLFDEVFFLKGLAMMGLYFLYLACISSVALFFSTVSKSYLLAILPTFGVYILFSILTIFGEVPVLEYFPGMMIANIAEVLHGVSTTSNLIGVIVVTVLIICGFLTGAIFKIRSIDVN